jgi:SAM-dependent methyltransferase
MAVTENQYFNQLASILKGYYYNGTIYHFFAHPYNATWANERSVEIPVFKKLLQTANGSILEVGNVLSHYQSVEHSVIDLFEEAPGVLNVDIVNFRPENRYDLILSISTLEHVGRDDEATPEKARHAIEHLKKLLVPGGRLIVSVPLGYNEFVDNLLSEVFDNVYYMERQDQYAWRQLPLSMIHDTSYNTANGGAKVVAFAYYTKPGQVSL